LRPIEFGQPVAVVGQFTGDDVAVEALEDVFDQFVRLGLLVAPGAVFGAPIVGFVRGSLGIR
jgi:hypothetical protein